MATLLVVEDDKGIQTLLENFLAADGHTITVAGDGVEAIARFSEGQYDLVLLDLMLPKIDGYGVCEVIRRTSQVPVIMLTALDAEENQLCGYDLQIDDYVTKPFSMQVLVRKVAAVLRRANGVQGAQEQEGIVYRELIVDTGAHEVYVHGKGIALTPKEYDVLLFLLQAQGRVLTRALLLEQVWGYDFFGDERVVDTHVKNLRRKLGVDYIQTIRGVGYRIDQVD